MSVFEAICLEGGWPQDEFIKTILSSLFLSAVHAGRD